MKRRHLTLLPVIPALALLGSVYLPFVNAPTLWFGMPSLFVWVSVWVLLITPTLLVVERGWARHRKEGDE
ncbi:hypothetical protein [Saccharopolyspora rosea]|uniref:DUF3311 domain-containing protein n=1 Tax=Saccharopolyspora rosea TaxID=524884 RepID=A0ABW3FUR8_9PSEU|nr:hypothetical protein [Saccharopolyspora rosea]